MSAAEIAEAFVGAQAPHMQKSGQGLKVAHYTMTSTNTGVDYVVLGDFTAVKNVCCQIVATGAINPCTISATTANQVTLTSATTGAMRMTVWGY